MRANLFVLLCHCGNISPLLSALPFSHLVLSSQGPRFFAEWMTIEHSDASQIKMFSIGTSRIFLAAATTVPNHTHYGLTVYEIMLNSSLDTVQTIQVEGLGGFQTFALGGVQYIAITCGLGEHGMASAQLFKWTDSGFTKQQEMPTNGATDVDFISSSQASFLAFSASSGSLPVVYVWDSENEQFIYYQSIPLVGAERVHFATAKNTAYLTLINSNTTSAVYAYQNPKFELLQDNVSSQSRDLYPFAVGSFLFLMALNQFEGTTHLSDSVLYRLSADHFLEHTAIPIRGEYVHYFPVKGEHFLVVASSGPSSGLFIYRLDGASVVQFQRISAPSASSVESFMLPDGCKVLLVSNVNGFPRLYKWASLGLMNNSCNQ